MIYFLVIVISILLLLSFVGYFVSRAKEKEKIVAEQKAAREKRLDKTDSAFSFKWTINVQATTIILLLTFLIVVLFWGPIKEVALKSPLVALGATIAMTMMLIGGDPKKTITKSRTIALITLISLFLFFIIWPEYIKNPTEKVFASTASKKEKKTEGRKIQAVIQGLSPTGITLQPGEKIVGTKDPDSPPVELVVRFPDGETVIINSKHWTSKNIGLTHVGHNVKGRPGEILFRGNAGGRYQWKKVSSNIGTLTPISTPTPPAPTSATATSSSPPVEAKNEKKPCPFE